MRKNFVWVSIFATEKWNPSKHFSANVYVWSQKVGCGCFPPYIVFALSMLFVLCCCFCGRSLSHTPSTCSNLYHSRFLLIFPAVFPRAFRRMHSVFCNQWWLLSDYYFLAMQFVFNQIVGSISFVVLVSVSDDASLIVTLVIFSRS